MQVPLAYFDTTNGSSDDIDLDAALHTNETISLGMVRLKATSPQPYGSLIFNPGGPGGSASEYVLAHARFSLLFNGAGSFGALLPIYYDIIGLDPRGVNRSSPIQCYDTPKAPQYSLPQNEIAFANQMTYNMRVWESCERTNGPLMKHLDTIHVVHDMELVRRALGDQKLNFFGVSYGTEIGSQYAEFFPKQINRMVLEGVSDHSAPESNTIVDQTLAFQVALEEFFRHCQSVGRCLSTGEDIIQAYQGLINATSMHAISALDCMEYLSPIHIVNTMRTQLMHFKPQTSFGRDSWMTLSDNIFTALEGDASDLMCPSSGSSIPNTFIAIGCQNWKRVVKSLRDFQRLDKILSTITPQAMGASQAWDFELLCLGWPAPVSNPQHVLHERTKDAPPILLVNSLYDAATGSAGANALREQMPDAVLVFVRTPGHGTSLNNHGDVFGAVEKFFLYGELPPDGVTFET